MATTKSTTVLFNDQSLSAGGADQNADVTIDTGYGAVLDVKLTNGATGPTVPAQVQIKTSPDGTNFYNMGGPLVGSTTNSAVRSWGGIVIPVGVKRVRVTAGSNTGQAVTVRAELTNVTAIA